MLIMLLTALFSAMIKELVNKLQYFYLTKHNALTNKIQIGLGPDGL